MFSVSSRLDARRLHAYLDEWPGVVHLVPPPQKSARETIVIPQAAVPRQCSISPQVGNDGAQLIVAGDELCRKRFHVLQSTRKERIVFRLIWIFDPAVSDLSCEALAEAGLGQFERRAPRWSNRLT